MENPFGNRLRLYENTSVRDHGHELTSVPPLYSVGLLKRRPIRIDTANRNLYILRLTTERSVHSVFVGVARHLRDGSDILRFIVVKSTLIGLKEEPSVGMVLEGDPIGDGIPGRPKVDGKWITRFLDSDLERERTLESARILASTFETMRELGLVQGLRTGSHVGLLELLSSHVMKEILLKAEGGVSYKETLKDSINSILAVIHNHSSVVTRSVTTEDLHRMEFSALHRDDAQQACHYVTKQFNPLYPGDFDPGAWRTLGFSDLFPDPLTPSDTAWSDSESYPLKEIRYLLANYIFSRREDVLGDLMDPGGHYWFASNAVMLCKSMTFFSAEYH